MMSPFDSKNKAATLLDRLALYLLGFLLCVGWFYFLWRRPAESLTAGSALFALFALSFLLFERSTLNQRSQALREQLGGMIAAEDLVLMPGSKACETVCLLLCQVLDAKALSPSLMQYEGETWLIRCCQCLRGSSASEGDVLAAHRARIQEEADQCALVSTGGFSPAAIRAAEWVDPPVRLVDGAQLRTLLGHMHPATDEEIARHARRRRKPFSFARMRRIALAPAKLRKYLLCAFLLLILYLIGQSPLYLLSSLLAYLLALLCRRANSRRFRL